MGPITRYGRAILLFLLIANAIMGSWCFVKDEDAANQVKLQVKNALGLCKMWMGKQAQVVADTQAELLEKKIVKNDELTKEFGISTLENGKKFQVQIVIRNINLKADRIKRCIEEYKSKIYEVVSASAGVGVTCFMGSAKFYYIIVVGIGSMFEKDLAPSPFSTSNSTGNGLTQKVDNSAATANDGNKDPEEQFKNALATLVSHQTVTMIKMSPEEKLKGAVERGDYLQEKYLKGFETVLGFTVDSKGNVTPTITKTNSFATGSCSGKVATADEFRKLHGKEPSDVCAAHISQFLNMNDTVDLVLKTVFGWSTLSYGAECAGMKYNIKDPVAFCVLVLKGK